MNLSSKMVLFREHRCLQPRDVAKELGLSLESYMDIENGRVKMSVGILEKLSGIYQVPKEIFIAEDKPYCMQAEVMYSNCTFISGSASSNGYINHQYNDRGIDEILFSKKEEIKSLQDQINLLQDQNAKLIELLGKGVTQTI
jgi:transcriptional regulator with XRE-family HTH domain